MKIAFVGRNLYGSGTSGSSVTSLSMGRYLTEICSRLAPKHEIHIIPGSFQGIPRDRFIVHKTYVPDRPEELKAWLFFVESSLVGWSLRKDLDLVVTQRLECSFLPNAVLQVFEPSKIYYAKVTKPIPPLRRLSRRLVEGYEAYIYAHRRGRIIVPAEGMRRDMCTYFGLSPEDVAVVPMGIDLKEFTPDNRELFRNQLRSELGIPQDAFVMLFAGRDWLRKGLQHAINSLTLLRNPRLYLVIVGDDDRRRLLPLLLHDLDGDNIKFVPYAKQIAPYYAAADVFVLPSYSESFSLVCYEAAASGLPVLATKLPGIEDLIEDGKTGFFVRPDSQDIARKVELLYSDPRLREQMGIKARAKAERFSWDECARKMELLLLEIHQKGRFYAS